MVHCESWRRLGGMTKVVKEKRPTFTSGCKSTSLLLRGKSTSDTGE
jgi:hypothetical protein